jgi:chorismate mutase
MNSRQLISKFVAQLCEKQYAFANSTLSSIVEAKLKEKIKKEANKLKSKADKKKDFLDKMNKGKKKSKMETKKNK